MKAPLGSSHSVPKRLMDAAIKFHGHLGPFLVLGLKAGLFANEALGKDCFKTRATVKTEIVPPCSCFVDGVQVATGCTMGKGNIELKKEDSLSVMFMKDCKKLELCLRNDVFESLKRILSEEESEKTALSLANKSAQELFDIREYCVHS